MSSRALAGMRMAIRNEKSIGLGVALVLLLLLAGFFSPLPYDPTEPHPFATLSPPGGEFWFGTDRVGFDVFSRTIAGATIDLPVALLGTTLSLIFGVPLGLIVSVKSRWFERVMRGLDMFQSFPLLVLAIVIAALTGNNLRNVVFAIALVNVPRFIRLVRSEALALRESRFIEAARSIGASEDKGDGAPHASQRRRDNPRSSFARGGTRHHRGRGAELSGNRCCAAGSQLGRDDPCRLAEHRYRRLVGVAFSRPCGLPHRDGTEPHFGRHSVGAGS